MRKIIVAGNWKMNITPSEAGKLVKTLAPNLNNDDVDIIMCVPAIDIVPVVEAVKEAGVNVGVGAENMYFEEKGAFTGEISADMITDAGAKYVIIGHSERRQYFKEDDAMLNKKIKKAIEHKIVPIICCGETLEQREAGGYIDFIKGQITAAYEGVSKEDALNTVVAYEPIWAIGTGKVATTEQAQEVCAEIRKVIADLYDAATADSIRILYGGSVNVKSASELFAQPDIDGGLIGGASLKPDFGTIVNYNK